MNNDLSSTVKILLNFNESSFFVCGAVVLFVLCMNTSFAESAIPVDSVDFSEISSQNLKPGPASMEVLTISGGTATVSLTDDVGKRVHLTNVPGVLLPKGVEVHGKVSVTLEAGPNGDVESVSVDDAANWAPE
jgi:hypothetical protein